MERKMSINHTQKDSLVGFMRDNPQLQTGRFTNEFTFKKAQKLWQEVSEMLNSVPNGAQKEWRQWRKTWQDIKKNTKSKAAAAKKHTLGTGGGEPANLSQIENEIMEIMNPTQIDGLKVEEAPLIFSFNESDIECFGAATVEAESSVNTQAQANAISQVQTSATHQANTSTNSDHDYIEKTPKINKMNKTTRLKNSLELSNRLLRSIDERNNSLDNYYKEKIKYFKDRTDVNLKISESLSKIADILKNYLQ